MTDKRKQPRTPLSLRPDNSEVIDSALLYREWDEDEQLTDELHRLARDAQDNFND